MWSQKKVCYEEQPSTMINTNAEKTEKASTPTLSIMISKSKYVFYTCLSLVVVVISMLLLFKEDIIGITLGGMGILAFGTCLPFCIARLISNKPHIVISEAGIEFCGLKIGTIPWNEITGAHLSYMQYSTFICLELRDPAKWLDKLSRLKRTTHPLHKGWGFGAINLELTGLKVDLKLF
jgi:hypothetical protein